SFCLAIVSAGFFPCTMMTAWHGMAATRQYRGLQKGLPTIIQNIGFRVAQKISNIPDEDHIMRHVPWGRLRRDEDDNVIGFLPQAFERRPDEESLSVSWVEHYSDPATRVRDAVWAVRNARRVGGRSAFAIGNVGKVK